MYRNNDINEYLPENAERKLVIIIYIYIYIAILYIVVLPQKVATTACSSKRNHSAGTVHPALVMKQAVVATF